MNQMSAPARWWNHINIWWCIAGCRAFEHGHNHDTESSQHLVISRGKDAGFMTPSKLNGHAKHQKQTARLNESETFLHHCFSHSLPIKCFLNVVIYGLIAMDVNIICNLGLEFGLDFISGILLIHLVDCQHSTLEIALRDKIEQDLTTNWLLFRLSSFVSWIKTVARFMYLNKKYKTATCKLGHCLRAEILFLVQFWYKLEWKCDTNPDSRMVRTMWLRLILL